jgi:hypothetical protein
MSKNRDPLALSPHWHIDCRIEAELPEGNIVGTRFLINVTFGAVALAALLFAGWLGYLDLNTRLQIRDWEQRINDNRPEVRDIQRMQREYAVEAAKIDQAWTLIRPQLYVSDFLANLGRTRPAPMVIDSIEWNDAGISAHGSLHENSQRAALILGDYLKLLNRDGNFTSVFGDGMKLASMDRGSGEGDPVFNFEITFRFRTQKSP